MHRSRRCCHRFVSPPSQCSWPPAAAHFAVPGTRSRAGRAAKPRSARSFDSVRSHRPNQRRHNQFANGGWLGGPRSRPTVRATDVRHARRRGRQAHARADRGAGAGGSGDTRKIADAYAAFMDETDRAKGIVRSSPSSLRSRRSRTAAPVHHAQPDPARRCRCPQRVQHHHRSTVQLWITEDLTIHSPARTCSRAASPTATTTWSTTSGSPTSAQVRDPNRRDATLSQPVGGRGRARKRSQDPGARAQIAQVRHRRRQARTSEGQQPWQRSAFARKAPGLELGRVLHRRRPRRSGGDHRVAAARHRHARPRRPRAARGMEGLPGVPRDLARGTVPAALVVDESFLFNGGLAGAEQLRERWEARSSSSTALRNGGRQAVRRSTSAATKAAADQMVRTRRRARPPDRPPQWMTPRPRRAPSRS